MRINSPKFNVMHKACMKASKSLIRDFGEIENLQVSSKGQGDFVSSADKRTEKIIIDELLKAYLYDMSKQLSVFVGLIITNCIIMGRAEAFALKNGPSKAFLDGLGNGLGYGLIIIVVSFFRELFGAGTITLPDGGAGYVLWSIPESWYAAGYENIGLLVLSPGAFIILGLVIWVQREFAGVEEDA